MRTNSKGMSGHHVSYGEEATEKLRKFSTGCTLDGRFLKIKEPT